MVARLAPSVRAGPYGLVPGNLNVVDIEVPVGGIAVPPEGNLSVSADIGCQVKGLGDWGRVAAI